MASVITDRELVQLQNFILETKGVLTFLHNTADKKTANLILSEGFKFEGYIDFTTDKISGIDLVELRYFFIQRGKYGSYTIIIQISDLLIEKYSKLVNDGRIHFSEILAKDYMINPDSGENIYTLPAFFIKGYYDQKKEEIIRNKLFNSETDLPVFYTNALRLRDELK